MSTDSVRGKFVFCPRGGKKTNLPNKVRALGNTLCLFQMWFPPFYGT